MLPTGCIHAGKNWKHCDQHLAGNANPSYTTRCGQPRHTAPCGCNSKVEDVNSHNILIDGVPSDADVSYTAANASFWLIDFGLAVDSQSWVSEKGRWRTLVSSQNPYPQHGPSASMADVSAAGQNTLEVIAGTGRQAPGSCTWLVRRALTTARTSATSTSHPAAKLLSTSTGSLTPVT